MKPARFMERKSKFTIGLIGNPNVGKSTLFNALTGARQHVGNWPGKTVEKKEGEFIFGRQNIKVVDLPGSYSLNAYTEEETIATDFILQARPEAVVQIIDAQNLTRNLFMASQLIELGAPLVLALNMIDLAKVDGLTINSDELARLLNVPVVPINARKKIGLEALIKTALVMADNKNDSALADSRKRRLPVFAKDKNDEAALASARYSFIKGISQAVVSRRLGKPGQNLSAKFDGLAINKFFGLPLFLIIIWSVFQATFKLSEPMVSWIESLIGGLSQYFTSWLINWGVNNWLVSLLTEGIIGGVGGVLVFIPIMGIMFLFIAVLEDSGYLARVAYIMDKLMCRIGLSGQAFIPLILGFGCNVPAIMATRTLPTKRDRLLTALIIPFMSCGARLPVYALFVGAFFTVYQGWVIFSLYLLGIAVAMAMGWVFRRFLFKEELSSPFVIELPPYRWPTMAGLLIHAGGKVWLFIKKAGTIILAFSVIIWALASLPVGVDYGAKQSWIGSVGQTMAPIFEPLGFANWQASVALIFGSVAKEVIVSTFGTIYGLETGPGQGNSTSLSQALQSDFTPLSAYAFMVFVLLYIPCVATLAVIKKETGSWRWVLFVIGYTLAIAWLMALIVYQGGKLLGFI